MGLSVMIAIVEAVSSEWVIRVLFGVINGFPNIVQVGHQVDVTDGNTVGFNRSQAPFA